MNLELFIARLKVVRFNQQSIAQKVDKLLAAGDDPTRHDLLTIRAMLLGLGECIDLLVDGADELRPNEQNDTALA
jgi:hypothetical protein